MSDLPAGEWSALLVGHQWPSATGLAALAAAEGNRAALASAYDEYGNALQALRTRNLGIQEGATADDLRRAFVDGETRARGISADSHTKETAYRSAQRWAADLRAELTAIAVQGNSSIRQILDSTAAPAEKVAALVDTVTEAHRSANARAATHCANLLDEIQTVLDTTGADVSARQFAHAHGSGLHGAFSMPDEQEIRTRVHHLVEGLPPAVSGSTDTGRAQPLPAGDAAGDAAIPAARDAGISGDTGRTGGQIADATAAAAAGAVSAGAALATEASAVPTDRPTAPDPAPPGTGIASSATALLVADGDRRSAGGTAGESLVPLPQGNKPSSGFVTATAISAPSAAPLIGYGADSRPLAAAPSTAAAGSAAAPGSAPVGANPAAAAHHPPLVHRQQSSARDAATARSPLPAATDPAAARVPGPTGKDRLRMLLAIVVHQQPAVGWAVGDLADGTSILVTDLAAGWIPPGIDLPAGLRLLQPRCRGGDLDDLLGPTRLAVTYRPGQDLPPLVGAAATASGQARSVAPVDEFRWELKQATQWRDGLPRIAHTLVGAMAAGGCLQSEIDLFRTHLRGVAHAVLTGYPGHRPADVASWQLLSSVDELISGHEELANYHFAWFRAQTARPGDIR